MGATIAGAPGLNRNAAGRAITSSRSSDARVPRHAPETAAGGDQSGSPRCDPVIGTWKALTAQVLDSVGTAGWIRTTTS
jgi:hypothetical protein